MPRGTYALVIELAAPARVAVGALGERDLAAGWYAYVGSALGPGGFARVDRHRAVADGEGGTRHWHVDYLLGHPEARIDEAIRFPCADAECEIARGVEGRRVEGFGASDCGCVSHLIHAADRESLVASVGEGADAP